MKLVLALALSVCAYSQTVKWAAPAYRVEGGSVDMSSASGFAPPVVASLPATCVVGQLVYLTTAAAGSNIYLCTSTNNWSQISSGSVASGNYTASFTAQTSVTLTHSAGTKAVIVACYDGSDIEVQPDTKTTSTTSAVTVTFNPALTGRCVVNTSGGSGGGGGGTSGVSSFNSRTGAVTPASGDYSFSLLSGTAALAQGGTNQTSWTSGKCVQVSSDGTKLESAAAACGTGGGGGTADVSMATGSASLSFSTFGGTGGCEEQTVTVSGAVAGDKVVVGLPVPLPAGIILGAAYASTTDTIVIRLCRLAGTGTISSLTFNAAILKSL